MPARLSAALRLASVGSNPTGPPNYTGDLMADDDADDEPVQCWHTEPGTPCDWNVCRQPERLATGDHGTDPAALGS